MEGGTRFFQWFSVTGQEATGPALAEIFFEKSILLILNSSLFHEELYGLDEPGKKKKKRDLST